MQEQQGLYHQDQCPMFFFIYSLHQSKHPHIKQIYFCQKSEGVEASSLPAHPPRSKRFCSSKGIVTPPTQTTILSRAQETIR